MTTLTSPTPKTHATALPNSARAVVVGAGGYAGAELAGILARHPSTAIVGLFASGKSAAESLAASRIDELFPRLRGSVDLPVQATTVEAIAAADPDVVFLATPHEVSHDLAPELLSRGAVVIDLSAAYRLREAALYPKHYSLTHEHHELLAAAVYGLPEINRALIAQANLIAVPGCYPTSAILPLRPLVEAKAIAADWRVIIDSTSGVSGAGRAPAVKSLFCEVSLQPYGVFAHRHSPEIAMHAGTDIIFTPHLGAFDRGILSTMHVRLADGWNLQRVSQALHSAYDNEPFVRLLPEGSGQWPSVTAVERTNFCDIGWAVDEASHHLIVVSAIDNLVKGAAGQAVQCMNIRFGSPEAAGLIL